MPSRGTGRLTRTLVSPDNHLLFPTSSSPDIASTAPCGGSRYSPLATSLCDCAPGSTINLLRSIMSPDVVVVATVGSQGPGTSLGGIRLRSVLCIAASRIRVHSHMSSPSPHSVSLCSIVSCFPHNVQSSVSTNRILCSLVFVGIKSWITMYHADLAASDVGMLWILFHTLSHSIPGWICITRTSRGGVACSSAFRTPCV